MTLEHNDLGASTDNSVIVAVTSSSRLILTKRISPQKQVSYDRCKFFNLWTYDIWNLHDLYLVVSKALYKPRCCLLRATVIDPTNTKNVPRWTKETEDGPATIVCRPKNWFAIDVDGYGTSTGDLKQDLQTVLLALGLEDVQCFAVATSNYLLKPGIRMRVFLWCDEPVSNKYLVAYFERSLDGHLDVAMFNPGQPIYVARPIFTGMDDPVTHPIYWQEGLNLGVTLPHINQWEDSNTETVEKRYTKPEAKRIMKAKLKFLEDAAEGSRHDILRETARLFGKFVLQGHIDKEDAEMSLVLSCMVWTARTRRSRNTDNDLKTILWGIEKGMSVTIEGE